jgi:cytochrome P450
VHGATPSLLERVVPSFTSKNGPTNEAFDLMGYALPPGTIIATQAWSMHRDPSIFPSPSTFLPDRWLKTQDNIEQLARMHQHLMPFGAGSRVCGGQNLAMIMMRIMVAIIARNYNVFAPAETNDRSMGVKDSFVSVQFLSLGHLSDSCILSDHFPGCNGM